MMDNQVDHDHYVGIHHFHDELIRVSLMHCYGSDNITKFKYCPMCGLKLDVKWK